MRRPVAAFMALALIAGCTTGPNSQVMVKGAGPDDLLKLRSGPGLNYSVIVGLPDGTRLNRGTCQPQGATTWCRVSLVASPRVVGYVSAEYLGVI